MSYGIIKLGELGKMSFGIKKLGELGEMSFGIMKLGEMSFGMSKFLHFDPIT